MNVFTTKLSAVVAHENAREQPRLTEDLKAVTNPDDELSTLRLAVDCPHNRRKAGDRAATKIVAIGEAAGEHDRVVAREVGFSVPNDVRFLWKYVMQHIMAVVVAPGAGK